MSYEFGSKVTREMGAFLKNLDLILLMNRASGNMFRYVFSNNSLVAVGKIDSQSGNIGEESLLHSSEAGKRKCE